VCAVMYAIHTKVVAATAITEFDISGETDPTEVLAEGTPGTVCDVHDVEVKHGGSLMYSVFFKGWGELFVLENQVRLP